MTDEYLYNLYEHWMDNARQTDEKHIRYVAEQIVKDFSAGLDVDPYGGGREVHIPWVRRRNRGTRCVFNENDALPKPDDGGWYDILIQVPLGMQGFALQMVIEAQLRRAVGENGRP